MDDSDSSNQSQSSDADTSAQEENEEDKRDIALCEDCIKHNIPGNPELSDSPADPVTFKQEVITTDYLENEQPILEYAICKKERSMSPDSPHQHGIYPPLPPEAPLQHSPFVIKPELTEPNRTSPKICGEFIQGRCAEEMCKFEHRSDLAQLATLGLLPMPPLIGPPPPPSPPEPEMFSDKHKEKGQNAPEYQMEIQISQSFNTDTQKRICSYLYRGPYCRNLSYFGHQRVCVPPPLTNNPPSPETRHSPPPQTNQSPSPDKFRIPAPQTSQPFCTAPLQINQPLRTPPSQTNQSPSPDKFRIPAPQTSQPFCTAPLQINQPLRTPPSQTNQSPSPDKFRIPAPQTSQPFCTAPLQINQPLRTPPPQTNQSPSPDKFRIPAPQTSQPFCTAPLQINQPPRTPPPQTNQPPSPDKFRIPAPRTSQPFSTAPPQINQPFRTPPPQTNQPPQPNRLRIPPSPPQINQPFHIPPIQTNKGSSQNRFCIPPPPFHPEFRFLSPPPNVHFQRDRFQSCPPHTYEPPTHFQRDRFRSRLPPPNEPSTHFQRDRVQSCRPHTYQPPTHFQRDQFRSRLPPPNEPSTHFQRDRFQSCPPHTYEPSTHFQRDQFQSRSPLTYKPPTPFKPDSFHVPPSPSLSSSAYIRRSTDIGHPPHPPLYPVFGLQRARATCAPCRDFIRGNCQRENCKYAHNRFINQVIDRKNILNFCYDYQNGYCQRKCNYIHASVFEEADFYRTGKLPVHLLMPRLSPPASTPRASSTEDLPSIANYSRPTSTSEVSTDEKPTCEDEPDPAVNPDDAVIDAMAASLAEKIKREWKRINLVSTLEPDPGAEGPTPNKTRKSE